MKVFTPTNKKMTVNENIARMVVTGDKINRQLKTCAMLSLEDVNSVNGIELRE